MIKGINFPSKQQWALISVVLFSILLIRECVCNGRNNKQEVIQPPPNINKQLVDTSKILSEFKKKQDDSFNKILKPLYAQNEINNGQFVNLANQNDELANINENLQRQLDVPDTCKKYTDILNASHNQYVAQTNKTIDQAKKSLIGLASTIKEQKNYLDAKDQLYARLKSVNDTCIANNAALEKYAKQLKPKHELGLMFSALNDFSTKNLKPARGGGLTWRNKRGLQFSISYYSNQIGTISIIKQLARF